jgi:hypothetical protein
MKLQTAILGAVLSSAFVGMAISQPAPRPSAAVPLSPPPLMSCTNSNLNGGIVGQRVVQGQIVFSRRLATVFDGAINDYGNSAGGDDLELFCVSRLQSDPLGIVAACLSKEACPWR